MSLLVAIQNALDIALHMASDEGWGVPASYAESFGMLATHGVIDASLVASMANLATLRNRLAHGYGTATWIASGPNCLPASPRWTHSRRRLRFVWHRPSRA